MKFLNPRVHGYLDYAAVAILALAPSIFGFAGVAAAVCYIVAAGQLAMSLATAYPLGLAKLIPFTVHGGIELALTIFFVIAPWLLGFAGDAASRNFFVISGIALFGLYMITNYKAADEYRRPTIHREAPTV